MSAQPLFFPASSHLLTFASIFYSAGDFGFSPIRLSLYYTQKRAKCQPKKSVAFQDKFCYTLTMLIFYLAIAVLMVPLGAGIAFISRRQQRHFGIIFGFTAGAVLGIVLMLMMHLYTAQGTTTIFVMWGGFLLITVLEYFTRRQENATRNHTKNLSLDLTLLGLSIHSLADGFNLVIAEREAALGGMLVLAVLLHRLPIATVMAAALYKQHSEKPPENTFIRIIGRLTPLMVGPLVGALLGERLLQGTFKELTEYLTAFAAGTLLHVVMDEFRAREPRTSRITKVVFIVGFIFTFCAIYFFQEFDLGHHH